MKRNRLNLKFICGICTFIFLLNTGISLAQAPSAKKTGTQNQQVKPAEPEKITSVEGITEFRLQNGLKVLLFPDVTKQTATVNVTYLVGSKHENYGETGMAHLLEHMMFKGSPLHTNIPQELTSHGARPNGTTWLDRTNYFETFSSTDENLNWALDLESDRMVNSYIAKKDLDSEFSVVRNEMESGENDPSNALSERVIATAYLWHNYGKSTIGARSDVEGVPIDRLQAFYHMYYQPDNAVLTVSGNFDPQKTLTLINQKFGIIPKPSRTLPMIYTIEPVQDGERNVTLRRVGDVQLVSAVYHVAPASHPDFQAIEVLMGLLSDEPSGRLYKKLIDTQKASNVNGYSYELKEPGMVYFEATVLKNKDLSEVKDILFSTVEDFYKDKPTKEEVERIKNKLLKNIDLVLNSSERVGLTLSEYIAQGDWRLLFYSRDILKKVNVEDVTRVATTYFKTSNRRTYGIFVPTEKPDRSEIPQAPDITAMLKDYKGSQVIAEGEAFEASPANIQKRLQNFSTEGLTVNIVPKKNRGEAVFASMTFRFGTENTLKNKETAAHFAANMLNKGTKKHTRQQIQDTLDLMKAKVRIYGGATDVNVSIETTRPNLQGVIKIVGEMLREPVFPADELDKLKLEEISNYEQDRSEPQSIAVNELQRYLDPYEKEDPRHVKTIDESIDAIKKVTSDEIKSFYTSFYGASNSYISVVGDCDAAQIKELLTTSFAAWKSSQSFARLSAKPKDKVSLNKVMQTPDKANAFFYALQPMYLTSKDEDYPALLLGNYILGGGFLNSRLASRIRQKDGLSYGVGSQVSMDYFEKNNGMFVTYAIYAPENVERLEAAYKEELQKLLKDGFTDQEVAEAQKGYLQTRKVSLAQDNNLAATLNAYSYYGVGIDWWQQQSDMIAKLNSTRINEVMRKYLNPEKISILKAGDFLKKSSKP